MKMEKETKQKIYNLEDAGHSLIEISQILKLNYNDVLNNCQATDEDNN